MKQLKYLSCILALSLAFTACEEEPDNIINASNMKLEASDLLPSSSNTNANVPGDNPTLSRLEFPHVKESGTQILVNEAGNEVNYCVEWDKEKMSQRYSCYQLNAKLGAKRVSRYIATGTELQYPFDDRVENYFNHTDPFYSTGFDHGHICPSADRLYSKLANVQTFYLTNMQPQVNGFNAGVWGNMELQVRDWDKDGFRKTLYIVKGGTIENTDAVPDAYQVKPRSGGDLIVPNYYYMAILCETPSGGYKAIGFWIKHEANNDNYEALTKYIVNIDELERLTGIDFFCNLPDQLEKQVEAASLQEVKSVWPLRKKS